MASVFTEKTRSLRVALIAALAGGATLAGEVLGSRLLRPLVGSTAVAQAGAVAGTLGALGLGAWWAARRLEENPTAARRIVERACALLAILSVLAPWLASALAGPAARVLVALANFSPSFADAIRAVLAVILSAPFGALSGAMYPCLALLHGHGAGRATAVSGAASSLGAALAALATTFVFAPALGVRWSLVACAVFYAIALALAQTFRGAALAESVAVPKRVIARGIDVPSQNAMLAALALMGFASSTWQLAMTRLGVLAFGPSAFALSAAVAAHTASLGLGEAAAAPRVDSARQPRAALIAVLAAAAILAVVCTGFAAHLPAWSAARFAAGTIPSTGSLWLRALALQLAVTLPVIALLGAAMPLSARVRADAGAKPADANAQVLVAMAAGNVAGALLTPLVLVPVLTLSGALFTASIALAGSAVLIVDRRAFATPGRAFVPALGIALLAIFGVRSARGWDTASLSSGPFLYTGAEDLDLGRVERVTYGREATVAVRRDESGAAILQIDGKIDATSGGDPTQILVGIIPAVLSAHPREVLVVGLGSGMTVDAVRDVPGVAQVTVTELLPEVISAARIEFRAANHDVLASPRVTTLRQDASLFLRGTNARYDVIVSEPSNPWVAGMADLFTVDALQAARARLNPGGVMAAWFHAYSTDASTFASIVATFREVFPRAALVEMVAGQDYMVVGMLEPVGVDVDRVAEVLTNPRLAEHLARAGINDRGSFFGRFIAGTDGVRAIASDAEVFRADDLRLEFRAPLLLYNDASTEIFALFARAQDLPLAGLAPRGASLAAILDESESARESGLHARQMAGARAANELAVAIHEGELAVAAAPRDAGLRTSLARLYIRRAGRRYRRRDPGGAEEDLRTTLELRPGLAEQFRARVVLGDMALSRSQFGAAAREYGGALEIARVESADAPELHVRMSQVLGALGDVVHQRSELDRAIRQCASPRRLAEIEAMRSALGEATGPADMTPTGATERGGPR